MPLSLFSFLKPTPKTKPRSHTMLCLAEHLMPGRAQRAETLHVAIVLVLTLPVRKYIINGTSQEIKEARIS